VNANGSRLDVWLLYCCEVCTEVHKQRVERRVPAGALSREQLAAYQGNAPTEVRRCAFAAGRGAEVAYRVTREPVPTCGALRAHVAQPEPCGVRWDRFLARELGWSRARLAREVANGRVRVNGRLALEREVADGDVLGLDLTASVH
jgi:hypothetical protein